MGIDRHRHSVHADINASADSMSCSRYRAFAWATVSSLRFRGGSGRGSDRDVDPIDFLIAITPT
ncbi:hypothetical protein C7H75_09240 [Prescottella equi]|nr:hypothetical protein C7H75_09240 [Prescottella equi]